MRLHALPIPVGLSVVGAKETRAKRLYEMAKE